MQVSLIKYLLVHAYKAGKLNDIKAFFADCGDALMRSPAAEEWSAWFALPYISSPSSHPTFQVITFPAECAGFEFPTILEESTMCICIESSAMLGCHAEMPARKQGAPSLVPDDARGSSS